MQNSKKKRKTARKEEELLLYLHEEHHESEKVAGRCIVGGFQGVARVTEDSCDDGRCKGLNYRIARVTEDSLESLSGHNDWLVEQMGAVIK